MLFRFTVDVSKDLQTYYDYENDLNESKRTIKILKSEFVEILEKRPSSGL